MHPHNYYLEVLTETGIFGFVILIGIFFLTLYISFYKKYFSQSLLKDNMLIIPFIFLFIAEIFPLKSTGSFFTTGNTTYLIIIMGILIGLARKDNSIEKKN
jgi:O-antigen ligase